MTLEDVLPAVETRQDGFGVRRFEEDDNWGRVELVDLAPQLTTPAAEQAIRARAARFITGRVPVVAPLYSIARSENSVSIVSGAPDGVTLADLLAALEFGTVTLNDGPLLELAEMIAGAVSDMHESGTFAHAALTPAHVLLRSDGSVLLTGAVYGDALQGLQRNREQLWREFSVALPPSAGVPRFDHRTDVTQLGILVLSVLLRRTLALDEYPRGLIELVNTATERMSVGAAGISALRQWTQQALQLQARTVFSSAIDAERSFAATVEKVSGTRTGAVAIQQVIRQLSGYKEPEQDIAPPPPPPPPPAHEPGPRKLERPKRRGLTSLRAIFGT